MKRYLAGLILLYGFSILHAGRIDTVMVYSPSMDKEIPNIVVVPDESTMSGKGFPVLYLLHGAGNDYTEWLRYRPDLDRVADEYGFIIVCPDAGRTSWYFDSPVDPSMKYETYVSDELVHWIDSHYPAIPEKGKRAIAGLSMGGHGALYLAFRHTDLYGAAGSMAGGVDIRPFPNNWDLSLRLGRYSEHPENWEKNTVINLLYHLNGKNLKILFDCGNDDPFCDANRRLHRKMLERNIPHTYIERPGGHNLKYWLETIKYQLFFFREFFQNES